MMRSVFPLALLMVGSCNSLGKGACEKVVLEVCDACDVDGYTKDVLCGCVEDGEVNNADDYFRNDDDAEMACAQIQNSLKPTYLTNEDAASCRSELDFLKEFGKDACEYLGYEDGYDGTDGYGGTDGTDGYDGYDGYDDDGDGGGGSSDPAVAFSWGASSVSFEVLGVPFASYLLGMAETGSGCGDGCWTGEDCLYGYGSLGPYCHSITDGTTATLRYGGNPTSLAAGTTVFTDDNAPAITYVLYCSDETLCWTWGHDIGYYSAESCTTLSR